MADNITLFNGAAWYVVFLFSVTVHEASHALVALKLGDNTAALGGQVTLDPTPHIRRAPFGMVLVPLLSYALSGWMMGWAHIPYDPQWAQRYPKRAALMSAAGPASNFVLMLLCALLIKLGIAFGYFDVPQSVGFGHVVTPVNEGIPFLLATLLGIGFSLNLLMFLFNLIPVPPLDGSALPLLVLSHEAANKYWQVLSSPGVSMFGIFIAWKISGAVFGPAHLFAINLLYPGMHYGAY